MENPQTSKSIIKDYRAAIKAKIDSDTELFKQNKLIGNLIKDDDKLWLCEINSHCHEYCKRWKGILKVSKEYLALVNKYTSETLLELGAYDNRRGASISPIEFLNNEYYDCFTDATDEQLKKEHVVKIVIGLYYKNATTGLIAFELLRCYANIIPFDFIDNKRWNLYKLVNEIPLLTKDLIKAMPRLLKETQTIDNVDITEDFEMFLKCDEYSNFCGNYGENKDEVLLSTDGKSHVHLTGNDDTAYWKSLESPEEVIEEINYLRKMQPINLTKDVWYRGYIPD